MLKDHLASATSLIDLAGRLGAVCLDHLELLRAEKKSPALIEVSTGLLEALKTHPIDDWLEPLPGVGYSHLLQAGALGEHLALAASGSPTGEYALLLGLCTHVLRAAFELPPDEVALARGTPIPIAKRDVHLLWPRATPSPETVHSNDLIDPRLGFVQFAATATAPIRAVLDFTRAADIDALGWHADQTRAGKADPSGPLNGLPVTAVILPADGGTVSARATPPTFFGTGPRRWRPNVILNLLRRARLEGASIAVLPEFALPAPDALEALITENAAAIPRLIVAGSSHREETAAAGAVARVNESRIYLDGALLHRAFKSKPYIHRREVEGGGKVALREDLTDEPKMIRVFSGVHTRFAVVICADINDESIPNLLQAAGANLLLVPAITPELGLMTRTASGLAGACQGFSVVANGRGPLDRSPTTFSSLVGIPRPKLEHQLWEIPAPVTRQSVLLLVNPNRARPRGRKCFLDVRGRPVA